jgi:hypothetical protein
MEAEQLFINEGANYFGNRLIYKNKDVGVKTPNSALVLNLAGECEFMHLSEITDVEVKPARKKAAAKEVVLTSDDDLDALLGN